MQTMAGIVALLIAAAGWFYLFYSRAAEKLAGVEEAQVNLRRVRLRRIGGCAMIGLAVAFYVSCVALIRRQLELFSGMMLAVLVLMGAVLVLGLIDLRLTRRLRRNQHTRDGGCDDLSPDQSGKPTGDKNVRKL